MSKKQEKITVNELETYLYSLELEKAKEKAKRINNYRNECEKNEKEIKDKEIQKIEKVVDKIYERRNQTKDEIISLLDQCEEIPKKTEKLQIAKYMLYRVDIRKAENIISKAIKNFSKRYSDIVEEIYDKIDDFPKLDNIEEVDFSIFRIDQEKLEKVKQQYKLEYTDEERRALIQPELNIIEKTKIFNTTPIPHEILKNSDRDIQSKMPKFNNARQRRLKIISTMEADYVKLEEPREINCMIDDAIANIDEIEDILTKSEYSKIKKLLVKRRTKIYRSTNDIRNVIKTKEKKTGIINYNIQEARYQRMEVLRGIIIEGTAIIKANSIIGAEERLNKLKISYEREKQFAAVIEKLGEDKPDYAIQNTEVSVLEKQIEDLNKQIEESKQITKEQEEKVAKARKELLVLWKIEIDSVISNKKEGLALPEAIEETNEIETDEKKTKKTLFKLKKIQSGKHACT